VGVVPHDTHHQLPHHQHLSSPLQEPRHPTLVAPSDRRPPHRPVVVAVASPQEVVARGLTAMLADYPDRVMVTALPSLWTKNPAAELVLYDTLNLAGDNGAALDHLLRDTDARVLLFSRDMRPDLRARAQARGCSAWVSMSCHAEELVHAVETTLSEAAAPHEDDRLGEDVGLTARAVEILALITQGLSNEEIADRLFVSGNTLKSHIRATYRRIGVSSRPQAVAWAMQNGFAVTESETAGTPGL
jgi:DNA-binding NarL/FixJ family response regulator